MVIKFWEPRLQLAAVFSLQYWHHINGPKCPSISPRSSYNGDSALGGCVALYCPPFRYIKPGSSLPLTPAYSTDTPNRRHVRALLSVPYQLRARSADVGRHIPSGHTKRRRSFGRGTLLRYTGTHRVKGALLHWLYPRETAQWCGTKHGRCQPESKGKVPRLVQPPPPRCALLLAGHCLGNMQAHSSAVCSAAGQLVNPMC